MAHRRAPSTKDAALLEQRRNYAVYLSKNKNMTGADIARELGVSPQAVSRWKKRSKLQGSVAAEPRTGRPPRLSSSQLVKLAHLLSKGPEWFDFDDRGWTTPRIVQVIWREFHVRYHADHVRRVLRKIGWTWQRPTAGLPVVLSPRVHVSSSSWGIRRVSVPFHPVPKAGKS